MKTNILLTILLSITIWSCGSRKVDINRSVTNVDTNLELNTKEIEFERKKIQEYLYSENLIADSIVFENDKTTIYNPNTWKIVAEKQETSEVDKSKEIELKEVAKVNSESVEKKIERFYRMAAPFLNLLAISFILFVLFLFIRKIWR